MRWLDWSQNITLHKHPKDGCFGSTPVRIPFRPVRALDGKAAGGQSVLPRPFPNRVDHLIQGLKKLRPVPLLESRRSTSDLPHLAEL